MGDKIVDCSLDTSSEIILIPGYLERELTKKQFRGRFWLPMIAIEVLGEVHVLVVIRGQPMPVNGVGSDHVAAMLLEIDWLGIQGAIWDLQRCERHMRREIHLLNIMKLRARFVGWCYRMKWRCWLEVTEMWWPVPRLGT